MSKLIHYSGPAGSILLPQGYTRLAYIESTGTLWMDTGWKPTSNMVTYIEYSHTESTTDTPLYGVRDSDRSNSYTCWSHLEEYSRGCIIVSIHGGTETSVTTTFHIGDKITLLSNKNSVKANGVSKTRTADGSTQANNLVLMGLRNGTNIDSRKFVGKIYFARFWDGDTLVRDFVPVQKSDGTIGLLDLVNNTFYGNSGTGIFIAGPEIPQGFPTSEYCLVEWLESTGKLKLLITGLTAAANDLFGINVMVANTTENKDKSFTVMSGNNLFLTCGHSYNATNKTIINSSSVGGASRHGGWIIPYGSFVLAELSTTICGTETLNRPLTNNVTNLTIMEYSSCRIAYFKVSHKNTVIHHLIPCYRRSDMKPGMYDLVGRLFYTNSGTGEFLLGPSITFGWGEVVNGAVGNHPAIPHNISTSEGRFGINTAFDFFGTNAYLNTDGLTTGKTYMGWFYTASKPKQLIFFTDSSSGMAFGITNNGTEAVISTENALNKVFTLSTWNIGWNHIAVVKADNGPQLYINGIAQTATSRTDGWTHSGGLWIGARSTFNNNFSGRCQDFKVFDTALTLAQIQQEM